MARKRGANEGTIFKRKDGRWCSAVDVGWENGKRKRKSFYGETRKEVADALNKALSEQAQSLPVTYDRQTVAQFFLRWLDESVRASVRPLTYEQYEQHFKLYIDPVIGQFQLVKLSPQHVQAFINAKLKDGLSPRTVQITLFVLRRAMTQAVKWDLVARNVAKLVDTPHAERPEIKPIVADQVQRFLNVMVGERIEAVFTIGLALGMRRGEVLGFRWDDIDFDRRTVSVKQAIQRSGGRFVDGERSTEQASFCDAEELSRYQDARYARLCRISFASTSSTSSRRASLGGIGWQDFGLVFTTRKGTPIEPRRLDTEFKRILRNAELPETIRLHDSRHFAASLLLAQGVHPRTVMEILGHSDISQTMNTYSHVVPLLMREAADKIDVAFGGQIVSGPSVVAVKLAVK